MAMISSRSFRSSTLCMFLLGPASVVCRPSTLMAACVVGAVCGAAWKGGSACYEAGLQGLG
jgi:hypothetical protein